MGEWIDLGEGQKGYRSAPGNGTGPPVLLLHAWWGLNQTIRDFADQLAGVGFVVVAPDLFDGVVVDTIEAANAAVGVADARLGASADADGRIAHLSAPLAALRADAAGAPGPIGAVGFSFGGAYALEAAYREPDLRNVALCYATGNSYDWSGTQVAFQGHYAEFDEFDSLDDVRAWVEPMRGSGGGFELHAYPGTKHWFMEPDRPEFDPDAAALAWGRIHEFLRRDG